MSKKISELTAATTPLAGTELVEVVQSGASKKVAVSNFGGSGTPGGSTTQVQYNNGGAFAGSSSFIWNESTKVLSVRGSIDAFRDDGTPADISVTNYGGTSMGVMHMRMANGTYASPTQVTAGQAYGGLGGRAYHSGGAFQVHSATAMHFIAAENQTATAYGGYISLWTTPKASTTRYERVHITDNGTLWARDTGTFDPTSAAQTKPFADALILASGSSGSSSVSCVNYASLGGGFRGGSCGGSPASPSASTVDSMLSYLGGHLFDGTSWTSGTKALITFKAAQNSTAINQGTYITFETTPLNSTTRAEGARLDPDGNFLIQLAGKGLRVKEGSNAKQGTATLTAGSVTVSNTSVTANSRIFLTSQADGGTPGWLRVSARTASTSFTITSSSGTDTSTVAYQIFEPA